MLSVAKALAGPVTPPLSRAPSDRWIGRHAAHHHRFRLRAEHPLCVCSQPQGPGSQSEQSRSCQRGGHLQLRWGPGERAGCSGAGGHLLPDSPAARSLRGLAPHEHRRQGGLTAATQCLRALSLGGRPSCGRFAGDPSLLWSGASSVPSLLPKDQFHKMVELTMAAREAYKAMLETTRQEPAQSPSGATKGGPPASPTEEPHHSECWEGPSPGQVAESPRTWIKVPALALAEEATV